MLLSLACDSRCLRAQLPWLSSTNPRALDLLSPYSLPMLVPNKPEDFKLRSFSHHTLSPFSSAMPPLRARRGVSLAPGTQVHHCLQH